MAGRTATLSIRIDPDVKARAEALFGSFGISVGDAVNLFLHQSLMEGGLPFAVKLPRYSAEMEEAMQEARDIAAGKVQGKRYRDFGEFLDEL